MLSCKALGQTSEALAEVADALAAEEGLSTTIEVGSGEVCVDEM